MAGIWPDIDTPDNEDCVNSLNLKLCSATQNVSTLTDGTEIKKKKKKENKHKTWHDRDK